MIDQEQLALVVAGVLTEGQRPLDDLLRVPTVSGVSRVNSSSDGPCP